MNNGVFYSGGGRQYAYFPVLANTSFRFFISVRKARVIKFINGQGAKTEWSNTSANPLTINFDYTTGDSSYFDVNSTSFTGDIKVFIATGLKDVYSLRLNWGATAAADVNSINVDFGTLLAQFSNLYSLDINYYGAGNNTYRKRLSGDLGQIPDSVRKYRILQTDVYNASTLLYLNLSSFENSNLEWFDRQYNNAAWDFDKLRVTGDLAKLPNSITFFRLQLMRSTSSITYTSGKAWGPLLQRLHLNGDYVIPTSIINAVLIDLDNSGTLPTGSSPTIAFKGTRTAASDTAVANLQAKGFSISLLA